MSTKQVNWVLFFLFSTLAFFGLSAEVFAEASGVGAVADTATQNLAGVAKLITAGAYVAGFGFAVAAIVKFKAHKDNPAQIPISMPIALLFVGAALIFAPSVFTSAGNTLFSSGGQVAGVSGLSDFGSPYSGGSADGGAAPAAPAAPATPG